MTPARVLLACSGMEHSHRGYESFARECFDHLKDDPRLDMRLVKATGPARDRERAVPAIKRDGLVARMAARRHANGAILAEQFAFGFSLQPVVLRWKPDVIYFSE